MRYVALQPPITPVGAQEQNPNEGHERLVRFASTFVRKTSLRSSGMRHMVISMVVFLFLSLRNTVRIPEQRDQ